MKRFILWLADKFHVDMTKTVYKEVIKTVEKPVYIAPNEVLEGNVFIDGDLSITGSLVVNGEISVYKKNN